MEESILCRQEDGIATVTINRPDKHNALDRATWGALADAVEACSADESLRCIVIRGAGTKAFAAGADISAFDEERSSPEKVKAYEDTAHRAMNAILEGRHPVVAMLQGFCLGGGFELATACDLRIAGETAKIGIPVKRMGLFLDFVLLDGLVNVVGRATALEMTLEGRTYEAQEALAKNMVHRVVPDDALEDEVMATARRIAEGAPLAARWHRQAIRRIADPAPLTEAEIEASYDYADSEDYQTGYRAFLAKEKPKFQGR